MAEGKVRRNIFSAGCTVPGGQTFFVCQFFQVAAHVIPIFRIPSFRAGAQAEVVASVQMPFPNVCCADAVVCETLSDGFYVGAQRDAVCKAAIGMGVCTGEQGRAGRAADRLTGVGILVADTVFRQTVQIRRMHVRIAVAANHILAGCVCH